MGSMPPIAGAALPNVVPRPVCPKPVKGALVVALPKLKPAGFAAVLVPNSPPVVVDPRVPVAPKVGVVPKPELPNPGVVPVPKEGVVLEAPNKPPVVVPDVLNPPKPEVLVAPKAGVVAPKLNAGCFAPNSDVPVLAVLPNPKEPGAVVVVAPNVGRTPKALACVVVPNVLPKPVPKAVDGCVVAVVLPKRPVPVGCPNIDFCCCWPNTEVPVVPKPVLVPNADVDAGVAMPKPVGLPKTFWLCVVVCPNSEPPVGANPPVVDVPKRGLFCVAPKLKADC